MNIKKTIFLVFCFSALSFTLNAQETGTFTDERDEQEYKWLKIGDQMWMGENLAFMPKEKTPGIERNLVNYFGILYDWEQAQKACPSGWHLPTLGEWEKFIKYIAGNHDDCNLNNHSWENVGKYLKSKESWKNIPEKNMLSDEYAFNAKATGWGDDTRNYTIGNDTYWWTSTLQNDYSSWAIKLWNNDHNLMIEDFNVKSYRNVRCIKGIPPDIPFVEINTPVHLEKNKVRLTSTLISTGSEEIKNYGFEWQAYSDSAFTINTKNKRLEKGNTFDTDITVNFGETYTYFSFAENKNGRGESVKKIFVVYPDGTFSKYGTNGNRFKYLRGKEKVVVRITASDTISELGFPNHVSLTNSQNVLKSGRNTNNKSYVELELNINIPETFRLLSPFPGKSNEIPDSAQQYLSLTNYSKEEIDFSREFINDLIKNKNYTYQHQMVEDFISWVEQFISYDYELSVNQDPLTVLNRRTATCVGYANLSKMIFRSLGIPCRIISCIVPPNCGWGFLQNGGRHAFVEIYYPGYGWVGTDPQHSVHFVDLFHIVNNVENGRAYFIPDNVNYEFIDSKNSLQLFAPKTEGSDSNEKSKLYCAQIQPIKTDSSSYNPFAFLEIIKRKDGSRYPLVNNSMTQIINAYSGFTEAIYNDGIRIRLFTDGTREIHFKNGEIYTDYPNGNPTK